MTVLRSLATGVAMALLAVACSSAVPAAPSSGGVGGTTGQPGQPGQPVQPGQPASAIDSCGILSDAEITAGTGHAVTERRASTLTQVFPSVCDIEMDAGSLTVGVMTTGGRHMYETSFEPFIGDSYLTEAVTGLGDKAGRAGEGDLMVLSGDVLFDLQYIGARTDKRAVVQYLAERILAKLPCISTGCPPIALPPGPIEGPPTPGPTQPTVDPGTLPSTGAQARLVNLYSEKGQPVTVDVYAYAWSAAEMMEVGALVASVPYGQASAWFNPGLVESPFGSDPYTKIDIYKGGDQSAPIAGISEFLGPGTVTTISVWQEEFFEGQPGAWVQTIYAEHPDYPIPTAAPGGGLLMSRYQGLLAEAEEAPFMYASVGDGCLESPIGRSDPEIPNAQPLGNDLVIPAGEWTLTVHDAPFGEIPTCAGQPLGPGAAVSVAPGDRLLAFPYRLPGATEISLLVVPFDP